MIERIRNVSLEEGFEKSRLPEFTAEEQEMLKGTCDYIALNHYNTYRVYFDEPGAGEHPSHGADVGVVGYDDPSGSQLAWGFRELLIWIKERYNNMPVIITENGLLDVGEMDDYNRANLMKQYLYELLKAIHEHDCNVFGYTFWCLLDTFEWFVGYT